MEWETIDISVVVLASSHNPTILHPSFLKSQGIVPQEWELAEPSISTPPFSLVKFANGIQFLVENNKLQVLESPPSVQCSQSKAPELARKYIEKLPHVPYTAVGINIGRIISYPNPGEELVNRFLNQEILRAYNPRIKEVGLRFVFPLEKGLLNLSCEPGKYRKKGEPETEGIVVKANYHFDLRDDSRLQAANEIIMDFVTYYEHYDAMMKQIFNWEE